jgi:hypothetical protein
MPPQQQQTVDPIKSYLDSVPTDNNTRADVWDAYHGAQSQQDFQDKFNKLNIPQSAKADLWDSKFANKSLSKFATPPPAPTPQATGPKPGANSSSPTWREMFHDPIGTGIPAILAPANRILADPLQKTLTGGYIPSESDLFARTQWAQGQAAQGGTAGIAADAKRIGGQTAAGLADYATSPAGIAAEFLTAVTGGTAAPFIAAGYSAGQGQQAIESYKQYKTNPTPENLQTVLTQSAMFTAMAAGGKVAENASKIKPVDLSQVVTNDRARMARSGEVPAPSQVSPKDPQLSLDFTKTIAPEPIGASTRTEPIPATVAPNPNLTKAAKIQAQATPPRPEWSAQQVDSEIQRVQGILRNPAASPEEKAIAQSQLDNYRNAPARNEPVSKPTSNGSSVLTDEKRAEISQLARAAVNRPEQAVQPNDKVQAPVTDPAAPFKQMVEAAGGKFVGMDKMGLVRYDVPADMVGGREGITVTSAASRMTPAFVKAQFDRKVQEFAPAKNVTPLPIEVAPEPVRDQDLESLKPEHQAIAKAAESDHPSTPAATRTPPQQVNEPLTAESLNAQFQKLVQFRNDLNNTNSLSQRASLVNERQADLNTMVGHLHERLKNASTDELQSLRDGIDQSATRDEKQGQAIHAMTDLTERVALNKKAAVDLRKIGYTEKSNAEVEGLPVEKVASTAPLSRGLLDDAQGRVPQSTIKDIIPRKKPDEVSQAAWDGLQSKIRANLERDYAELQRDLSIAADTSANLEETNIPERLRKLDADARMLGKFPEPKLGRRPEGEIQIGQHGEVLPSGSMDGWTLKKATQALGRYLRQMPESAEFRQAANDKIESARLKRNLIGDIDDELKSRQPRLGEKGAVGEAVAPTIPSINEVLDSASKAGYKAYVVNEKNPITGKYGWLSPDGRSFIDNGGDSHNKVARNVLGSERLPGPNGTWREETGTGPGTSYAKLLENGWVRKSSEQSYHVNDIDAKAVDSIETDQIRNGHYGQRVYIDFNNGYNSANGKLGFLEIDPGWDDLRSAVAKEARKQGFYSEAGKVPGHEILGGMAAGMLAGSPHGFGGMAVGGFLGAVTPAVMRMRPVMDAWDSVKNVVKASGVNPRDWFAGPQDNQAATPKLQSIRDEQRLNRMAPERLLSSRIAQIPGNIWKALDPYAFVTDRPNPLQKWTMAQDPRGQYFRNAQGQFAIGESPYVAVRNAVMGIRGKIGDARQMFADIEHDAHAANLHGEVQDFLNLRGYNRAYQVVLEHAQELIQDNNKAKQALAAETDVRKRVQLQDQIKDNTDALNDIHDKIKSKTVVPKNYDPTSIQRDLDALKARLSPDQMQKVQDLAKRVWDVNRKSLDMIADVAHGGKNAIITQEAYNKYIGRGNEYIPMQRILETLSDADKNTYGKTSPLYLRSQSVIREMEGSAKTNVDPFQASADGAAHAIREFYRNQTLGTFIDSAMKDPDIGSYFKPVKDDYVAKKDERVVGMYQGGKQQRYAVPDWLGQSLDTTTLAQTQSMLGAVNRLITKTFKLGATIYNPLWVVRKQLPSMAIRSLVTDEGPLNPVQFAKTFANSIKEAWTHDDQWQEFAKTGLTRGTLMRMMYPEQDISASKLGWKGPLNWKHPINTLRQLSDLATDVAMMNHWTRLRQAGRTPEEATFLTQTRGPLPDYAQLGKLDGPIAIATTFLRAGFQHKRGALALATDKEFRGKLALTMTAMALPTLALAIHNIQQTDEKNHSLWERVPTSDKENYHVFLTGGVDENGRPNSFKIPKAELIIAYGNLAEEEMYNGLGKIYNSFATNKSVAQTISDQVSRFIPTNPQFDTQKMGTPGQAAQEVGSKVGYNLWSQTVPTGRVPVEELMNRQVQFGQARPIVTNPKLPPEMQGYGDKNVSPTMMFMGQQLGQSPQRLEHIARGMLGPLATLAEKGTDPIFAQDYPKAQGKGSASSTFSGSSVNQREMDLTNKFYQDVQTVSAPYQTYLMLKQNNPTAAAAYAQAHPNEIWRGPLAQQMTERLQNVNNIQKQLEAQPPSSNRDAALKNLHDAKATILSAFTNTLEGAVNTTSTMGGTAK